MSQTDEPNVAPSSKQGPLLPEGLATDRYDVILHVVGRLYGGMPARRETLEKMPWRERNEQLQAQAAAASEETLPGEEQAAELVTVFRRHNGALAISANQLRTFMQEVAADWMGADSEYYVLRRALRRNLLVVPTLIPVERREPGGYSPVDEPDSIDYIPRPIRRAPFERSILQQPEYVADVYLRFSLLVGRWGSGVTLGEEVLRYLLEVGMTYVGLGAQRGLQEVGRGWIVSWTRVTIGEPVRPPAIPKRQRARRTTTAERGDDSPPA